MTGAGMTGLELPDPIDPSHISTPRTERNHA